MFSVVFYKINLGLCCREINFTKTSGKSKDKNRPKIPECPKIASLF